MKKIILLFLFLGISNLVLSQKLIVHHLDENDNETGIETYQLGDFIVIGHAKKGKKPHYFEGKITGIFKNRGTLRVFDFARSTRVMPIVGKKISIDEIVGIAKPDRKEIKGRENRAVAATAAGVFGSALGGNVGDAIMFGSVGGAIVSDFVSRNKVSKQRIKCEITEY